MRAVHLECGWERQVRGSILLLASAVALSLVSCERAMCGGAGPCPCPEGLGLCKLGPSAYTCRDLMVDNGSCGACGVGCGLGTCTAGTCVCAGPPVKYCPVPVWPAFEGPGSYAFVCVDPTSDRSNCGDCGIVCAYPLTACVAGKCQ